MSEIKLSDYIVKFIEDLGVKHVFLISGGGNIHLIDSIGNSNRISYVCNYHEQACATSAESYARVTGNLGVCIVTTGPGGTNAITGALGAWLDSIPMLVISGQVKRETIGAGINGMRQLGDQEINIVDIVKPMTKYAVTVFEPTDIRYHLEKAVYIAKIGRPGPVWIDVPLDVQAWKVNEATLRSFSPHEYKLPFDTATSKLRELVRKCLNRLLESKRPVFYVGNGIRLAHAEKELLELIRLLKIPVLTSYAGYDLVPSDNMYFFGRAHAFGQRAANFILQNSDYLLSVGARLDIRTIGFTYKAFAREAFKVIVDIDKTELEKPFIKADVSINYHAKDFLNEMIKQTKNIASIPVFPTWLAYGRSLTKKYPNVPRKFWNEKKYVNPYCLIETIGEMLQKNEIIVVSDGVGPLNCSYQALKIKSGQRVILNNGCAQMGYGLPAAVGAAFAVNRIKRIICFEGDGSLQLNIHELQTMKYYNLPIKLFIYSNDGYLSIRNSQQALFQGKYVAVDSKTGVASPDFVKIAKAYGLPAIRINNHKDMKGKIKKVLNSKGPMVCDINAVRNLILTPKVTARKRPDGQFESSPLEDMGPFLPRDEFEKNMIIPLWKG